MFKSFLHLFFGSLAGKLAGVLREVLLAGLFGTSGMVAALRAAQSATLVPVNFFTADTLSAGFLPLYARYRDSDGRRAGSLFWWTAGLLLVASVLTVTLLLAAAPYWIRALVPGFSASERALTVEFVRIMGLGVPFYIAGGLFSYLEMGHGVYTLASARATLQSAGLIVGTLVAYVMRVPSLLAWGFTVAYLVYSVWGFARIVRRGWVPLPSLLRSEDIRSVAGEFWHVVKPLMLIPVLLQGNTVAERAVASLLGVSTFAALDYAKFISDTGILLFAVPLGLAGLSAISKMSDEEARVSLERLLPPLLLASVPVSMALAVNCRWVIAIVYQRGHFDAESTHLTQLILWGYALGFWAQVASYVLMKSLSARLLNTAVFRIMAAGLVVNMVINFSFYRVVGPAVLGIGSCANGVVLFALSTRALGLTGTVLKRLAWLALGSLGYASIEMMPIAQGWLGMLVAAIWFMAWWGAFIAVVPTLRTDARFMIEKWSTAR